MIRLRAHLLPQRFVFRGEIVEPLAESVELRGDLRADLLVKVFG
jgi:hypothetical protein